MQVERRAHRRLPDHKVHFADMKEARVFDEDREVGHKEAYKDWSPAHPANRTFYAEVEKEPGF